MTLYHADMFRAQLQLTPIKKNKKTFQQFKNLNGSRQFLCLSRWVEDWKFLSWAAISRQRLAIIERGIHGGRGTETISTPAVWKLLPK